MSHADIFYGICIVVDYWMLKGLEFDGTQAFSENDILNSIVAYILKAKGSVKLRETFRFYIHNNQMKKIVLTQLFRVFAMSLEKPHETPVEMLQTEREKKEDRERIRVHTARLRELSSMLINIFVEFIYENLGNSPIREFMCDNLAPFIKQKKVSFEPYFLDYLKKMLDYLGLNHSLNLYDMSFMLVVINNTVFDTKKSLAILDHLVNLFFLSVPQARFLLICINTILVKMPKSDPVGFGH